jgi:hypothetical protein
MFIDASSSLQPDDQQKAVDDAAALKLMSQPYRLTAADLDRAAQLGQTLGGVRAIEKGLAAQIRLAPAPSQATDAAASDNPDVTLASAN